MGTRTTDRNLLVGILALQMDCISQSQLIAVLQAWLLQKNRSVEDLLLEQHAISAETRDFLQAIVARHLELHADAAARSLAALSSIEPLRQTLAALGDPEIDQSMDFAFEIRQSRQGSDSPPPDGDATTSFRQDEKRGDRRFRILRPHARGGLGQVSVAEDTELHREVALKELQDRYLGDETSRARFMMEGEVTGQLEHPGIVPVYSLGRSPTGAPFYVMRFIRGDSLKDAIAALHGPKLEHLTPEARHQLLHKLIRRLIDVCNAIEYAHSRGVLHRDLKPGNIMLGKYGETLVVDWGLAKPVGRKGPHGPGDEGTFVPSSGDGSSETRMGSVVGTLAYMSPEQAAGQLDSLDATSDVYCLGGTLYHILTGRPPIEKGSTEDMIEAARAGRFPSPREIVPGVSPALEAICLKAMAVAQSARYPTAAALAADLELWLADEPVSVYREPVTTRIARWVKRNRTLASTLAVAVTLTAIGLLIATTLVSRQNERLRQKNAEIEAQRRELAENRDLLTDLSMGTLDAAETELSRLAGASNFRTRVMAKSTDAFRKLHEDDSADPVVATAFARSLRFSANQLARTGRAAEAVPQLKRSIELQSRFLSESGNPIEAKNQLSETYRDLATSLKAVDDLDGAKAALIAARPLINEVIASKPDSIPYQRNSAMVALSSISLLRDLGDPAGALENARTSSDAFLKLADAEGTIQKDHVMAMLSVAWQGKLLDETGRNAEARQLFQEVIPRGRKWFAELPSAADTIYPFARLLHWDVDGASQSGAVSDEQLAVLLEAIALNARLTSGSSPQPGYVYNHLDSLRTRGRVERLRGDSPAATATLAGATTACRDLLAKQDTSSNLALLAEILLELAESQLAAGDRAAATTQAQDAVRQMEAASAKAPKDLFVRNRLAVFRDRLAAMQAAP